MKRKLLLLAAILAMPLVLFAAGSGFEQEISSFRKSMIPFCAQLQMSAPDSSAESLTAWSDRLIQSWTGLAIVYKDAAPEHYAGDPLWGNYFAEMADNLSLMRQKTAAGHYRRAAWFCGQNCALFVKMRQVNGRTDISDKLFGFRGQSRLLMDLVRAGKNKKGIAEMTAGLKKQLSEIDKMPAPPAVNDQSQYQQLRRTFVRDAALWLKSAPTGKSDEAGKAFQSMWLSLGSLYRQSL